MFSCVVFLINETSGQSIFQNNYILANSYSAFRPVHKYNYFAQNSPSSLFYSLSILRPTLGLPRLLVTNDTNQSLSENYNVFAYFEKLGW